MSIKVGLYDFLANTIPGGLYLFLIFYSLNTFNVFTFEIGSIEFSLFQVIVIAIVSFVIGLIFNPITRFIFRPFHKTLEVQKKALLECKEKYSDRYPNIEIKFDIRHIPLMVEYLRKENIDIAIEIERFNIISILLRNVSGFFGVFSVVLVSQSIVNGFKIFPLFLGLCSLLLCFLSGQESIRLKENFFRKVFESILVRSLKISHFAKVKKNKKRN